MFTLSGHTAAVTCIKWGGKNWIYSGSQDKSIRIWDAKDVYLEMSDLILGEITTYFVCSRALGEYNVIIDGFRHSYGGV